MKIAYFDYASIFILLIVFLSLLLRKIIHGKTNFAFLLVNIELFITILVGCVCLNLDNYTSDCRTLKFIFHGLYLGLHSLTSTVYLYYLIVLIGSSFKFHTRKVLYSFLFSPTILIVVQLTINIFTKHIYWIDTYNVYRKSYWIYSLYALSFLNILYGLYITIRYRSLFPKRTYFSITTLFPLITIPMIIENFFPNIVIEPFGNALAVLLISLTIQRPEELTDLKTGLLNRLSYKEDFKKSAANKRYTYHVLISFCNYINLKKIIGYDTDFDLSVYLTNIIRHILSEEKLKWDLYYLENGKFRIVIDTYKSSKLESVTQLINDEFKRPHYYQKIEMNFMAIVCIVKVPEELNNYDTLMVFGDDISNAKYYSGSVLYAKNLFKTNYYQKLRLIDSMIEKGFENNSYSIEYQPIFSTTENRYVSAEALIRLNDERYGYISPEIFIPSAEISGAIHKIENYALEEVCKFISSNEYKELGLQFIDINMSATHCMQDNIVSQIEELLEKYNISKKSLNFSISEAKLSQSPEKIMENIHALYQSGIALTLDNFGSGFSNIHRLSKLPVKIVKIDKTLIQDITTENVSIIISKLIEIIKSLNMQIVIEGVETPELLSYYKEYKSDYIQGFFFSKSLPKDKFIKFIREKNELN